MSSQRSVKRSAPKPPAPPPSFWAQWLTLDRIIIGGTVLVTVLIIGIVAIGSGSNYAVRNTDIDGVEGFPRPQPSHVNEPVDYEQTPPVGGPHYSVWQQCGVYTEPLFDEYAVHSLEHGAVWITYQPDLAADQVATLRDITRRSTHRLLSPYPGIDSPIILSAWGYQLRLDNADDVRLMQFILKYEQGEQTPELGAVCSGGVTLTKS